jgi:gamma-glutamylputrescine synthase
LHNGDLQALASLLKQSFGLRAVIGAELECYVPLTADETESFWKPIHDWMLAQDIPLKRIEKERGEHQFELVLGTASADEMALHVQRIKDRLHTQAEHSKTNVTFVAKPNRQQPSSGLHVHVHLENEAAQNVFYKTSEEMSEALGQSLAGLLGTIPLAMDIWCPDEEGYLRFNDPDHVPRTLSWGMNNRYAALRIPATINPFKVVEHRMCSANADPYTAISAILAGIIVGLEYALPVPEQEFGKPNARPPAEWVSFLEPTAQVRFLQLLGKAADEINHVADITAIA